MWLRKKRLQTEPLEEMDTAELEKATYSQYVIAENERTTVETQREVVKRLLAKLQESDRTIITLHYFSEMSAGEIGAFLGVSVNTIKSRLRPGTATLEARGADDKGSTGQLPNHAASDGEYHARDFASETDCPVWR